MKESMKKFGIYLSVFAIILSAFGSNVYANDDESIVDVVSTEETQELQENESFQTEETTEEIQHEVEEVVVPMDEETSKESFVESVEQAPIADSYKFDQFYSYSSAWAYNNILSRARFKDGFTIFNRLHKKNTGIGINGITTGSANVVILNDVMSFDGNAMDGSKMYLTRLVLQDFGDANNIRVYAKKSQGENWGEIYNGMATTLTFTEADGYLYTKIVYENVSDVAYAEIRCDYKPTTELNTIVQAKDQNFFPATMVAYAGMTIQNAETGEWIWANDGSGYAISEDEYYVIDATNQVGKAGSTTEQIDTKAYRLVDNVEVVRRATYIRVVDWLSVHNMPTNAVAFNHEKYQYDITANGPIYMPGGTQNLSINEVTYALYLPKNMFLSEDFAVGDRIGAYMGEGVWGAGGTWYASSIKKEMVTINNESRQKVIIGFTIEGNAWLGSDAIINTIPLYTTDFETYKPGTVFSYPTRLVIGGYDNLNREHINNTGVWYEDVEGAGFTPDGKKILDNNKTDWVFAVDAYGVIPEGKAISYLPNGGVGAVEDSASPYITGTNAIVLPSTGMTYQNHKFVSWNTMADGSGQTYLPGDAVVMAADVVLYAQWASEEYTITFESNGGTTVESETVLVNTPFTQPVPPTRTGYTFGGWYVDEAFTTLYDFATPATADITVYAKWNINPYTITYETNGGSAVDAETVNYLELFSEPTNPTRTGYTFDGWYVDEAFTTLYDFTTPATADITVYAKWNINPYTITYEANGGSVVDAETVNYLELFSEPTNPTRTGYTFDGWYVDEAFTTLYDFTTPATADITVYAKWLKVEVVGLDSDPKTATTHTTGETALIAMISAFIVMAFIKRQRKKEDF